MDLYPEDLGQQISHELQQQRLLASRGAGSPPNMGSLGGGILLGIVLSGVFWAIQTYFFAVLSTLCTLSLFIWYTAMALRLMDASEKVQAPIMPYELKIVRQRADDTLRQRYLDLAQAVISLPDTNDETANREVQDAVTALGTAIEALPPEQTVVTDDPSALRAEAQAQIENVQTESDAVIAASRHRRAESLLRRADTAARTILLLRRNMALREEVGEQIKALGTSLTALQVGGRQSVPELSGLAASIQRVALEANAVTVARAEVDTLLSLPTQRLEEAQAVRISL